MIFSTVRSLPEYKIEGHPTIGWCRQNLGFITDQNQINVALTRARKGLIIIGKISCSVSVMQSLSPKLNSAGADNKKNVYCSCLKKH